MALTGVRTFPLGRVRWSVIAYIFIILLIVTFSVYSYALDYALLNDIRNSGSLPYFSIFYKVLNNRPDVSYMTTGISDGGFSVDVLGDDGSTAFVASVSKLTECDIANIRNELSKRNQLTDLADRVLSKLAGNGLVFARIGWKDDPMIDVNGYPRTGLYYPSMNIIVFKGSDVLLHEIGHAVMAAISDNDVDYMVKLCNDGVGTDYLFGRRSEDMADFLAEAMASKGRDSRYEAAYVVLDRFLE